MKSVDVVNINDPFFFPRSPRSSFPLWRCPFRIWSPAGRPLRPAGSRTEGFPAERTWCRISGLLVYEGKCSRILQGGKKRAWFEIFRANLYQTRVKAAAHENLQSILMCLLMRDVSATVHDPKSEHPELSLAKYWHIFNLNTEYSLNIDSLTVFILYTFPRELKKRT